MGPGTETSIGVMFVSMLIALRAASVLPKLVILSLVIIETGAPVRMLVEPPLPTVPPGTGSPPLPKSAEFIGLPEIGRASCRERVYIRTDAAGVKEYNRREGHRSTRSGRAGQHRRWDQGLRRQLG